MNVLLSERQLKNHHKNSYLLRFSLQQNTDNVIFFFFKRPDLLLYLQSPKPWCVV